MRTGITQKVPTGDPWVQIIVNSDTHTTQGGGGNDLLMRCYTDEQIYGGQYVFELDNSDESLNSKDYTGYPLTLKWGYLGETQSIASPLWVWSQQTVSRDGKLLLQLNCVDIWAFIAAHDATVANASYNQEWQQSDKLSEKYMADGVTLLSVGAPALYATLVANGNKTIWAILQDFQSPLDVTITLDDTDSYINTLKPPIGISNARSGLWSLMDMTESYLKWKTNGQLGVYQPDNHATVYTFNHLNTFYTEVDEAGTTIPNVVVFWSYNEDGDEWIYSDWETEGFEHGTDETSRSRTGQDVIRHYMVAGMDNNNMRTQAELDSYADATIAKIMAERNQGFLIAPMHCSLELFDKIQVNDDRYTSDRVVTGYVHRIVREYDRGVYRCIVYLGGVSSGYTTPGGAPGNGMQGGETPPAPPEIPDFDIPPWSDILPQAVQGYMHDIVFSATDWDTVAWTSGTLKFYDETTQAVLSGNTGNLADDDIYYIYFDLEDASPNVLKVTTDGDYNANHISDHTGVLCVCQRASAAAYGKATFLPGWEKQPLITPDMIYMPSIQEWDDGSGNHYYKIGNTQIYGNQIKISADTYFMENYNPTQKTKTFHTQPTTPYHLGDIWIDDKVYKYCTTARESGSFDAGDWTESSKKRIGTTYISDGKLYLSSVIEDATHRTVTDTEMSLWDDAYDLADRQVIFRQASTPSAEHIGDLWYDTDDNDKCYRASSVGTGGWVRQYTEIDGGHIKTGTIDASSVTIQTAASGARVVLNSGGMVVYENAAIKLYNSATYAAYIGCDTTDVYFYVLNRDLTIHSNQDFDLSCDDFLLFADNIIISASEIQMHMMTSLILPRATSAPSSPLEGQACYNTTSHHWNVYRGATDGWDHVNWDSGWA